MGEGFLVGILVLSIVAAVAGVSVAIPSGEDPQPTIIRRHKAMVKERFMVPRFLEQTGTGLKLWILL